MLWNTIPGALSLIPEYSDTLQSYPFFHQQLGYSPQEQFTAVIYATSPVMLSSSPLFRLIRTIAKTSYVQKVRLKSQLHVTTNQSLFKIQIPLSKLTYHQRVKNQLSLSEHFVIITYCHQSNCYCVVTVYAPTN